MLSKILAVAALAATVSGHGDHADQTPIEGPHKALWYNTLPGDGGTQVGPGAAYRVLCLLTVNFTGRFGLFWHIYLRALAILPVPS